MNEIFNCDFNLKRERLQCMLLIIKQTQSSYVRSHRYFFVTMKHITFKIAGSNF